MFADAASEGLPEYSLNQLYGFMDENDLSEDDMYYYADSACDDKGIGASCTIKVDDGVEFGIGICIEVPGFEGSGELTCNINVPEMNCQTMSFASPSLLFGFLTLIGFMAYTRRRRS